MALTQVSSLNLNQTGWSTAAYFSLRPELYYDGLCEVQTTGDTNRGATLKFIITSDLAAATTALTETSDVTAVAMADSTVTVTLAEYGNAVQTTAKLRSTAFRPVNPLVANVIGYNAGVSIDTVAQTAFSGGTNVRYSGTATSRTTIGTSDTLNGNDVRRAVADLRSANVGTFGGTYAGIIHPDVSYDFRGATGGTNWSDPHVYSAPDAIFNGSIGTFQGVRFMESPRAPLFVDASNDAGAGGTIDAYGTLVWGRQAMAKGYSVGADYGSQPILVESPVIDVLRRFEGMGWKHLVGYSVFRQAALRRIESASSIGTNV